MTRSPSASACHPARRSNKHPATMHIRRQQDLSRPGPKQNSRGFTLAEMAVVVLITGLMLGAAASIALPILQKARRIDTDQKMQNIARALDDYAVQNFRLPCPAVPDNKIANPPWGFEAGSGPAGNIVPSDCGSEAAGWEGIIPFRTLNIPVDWIRDSSDHYITYAISPAFAQDVMKDSLPVHSRCRTADWFHGGREVFTTRHVTDPKSGKPALKRTHRKIGEKGPLLLLRRPARHRSGDPRCQQTGADCHPASGLAGLLPPRQCHLTPSDPLRPRCPGYASMMTGRTALVYVLVSHGSETGTVIPGQARAAPRFPLTGATPPGNRERWKRGDRGLYGDPARPTEPVQEKWASITSSSGAPRTWFLPNRARAVRCHERSVGHNTG